MNKIKHILCLLCFFFSVSLIAQSAKVKGTLIDSVDELPLIGVSIVTSTGIGTTTDIDGNYILKLPEGNHTIFYTYIGYETKKAEVNLAKDEVVFFDFKMKESAQSLETVVISTSKFKKELKEAVSSVQVIGANSIQNRVSTDLKDAVRTIPGFQIIDGQPSIRGGSGFAYGAGSRVIVVVDGQPLMSADRGDVKWNFIPLENVEQIEVLKGAASVLYGASALNGIINLKTAEPSDNPYTSLSFYNKVFGNPKRAISKWWNTPRHITGVTFAHRRKIGRFDLTLGANLHDNQSYLDGADERHSRFTMNLRYRPKFQRLTYGINANYTDSYEQVYVIWKNAEDGILKSDDDNQKYYRFLNFNIDPWINYFDRWNGKHTLKTRYYKTRQFISRGNNDGDLVNFDYQFLKETEINLNFIVGANYMYRRMYNFDAGTGGEFTASQTSFFTQADQKIGKHNFSAGMRLESYKIDDKQTKVIPSFRAGANFHINNKNNLRASFGQGYRLPSFIESFVNVTAGEYINILPNPFLKPEDGWSAELAWRKSFGNNKTGGFFDFATFWQEYENMIEFQFGYYQEELDSLIALGLVDESDLGNPIAAFGFRSDNITKTRIAGFETTFNLSHKFDDESAINGNMGYTYVYPIDLSSFQPLSEVAENDTSTNLIRPGEFIKNAIGAFVSDPSDPELSNLLKYRFRHSVAGEIEYVGKKFDVGFNFNFYSHMEKIDEIFYGEGEFANIIKIIDSDGQPINGLKDWRDANPDGIWVLNARAAYKLNEEFRILFGVENFLNKEYAIRPARLEAPRTFVMQCRLTF